MVLRSKSNMLEKIKNLFGKVKTWLVAGLALFVGVLLSLLHVKQKKIEGLKKDLEKSETNNNLNRENVAILEKQIDATKDLNETAESYNNLVNSFNSNK